MGKGIISLIMLLAPVLPAFAASATDLKDNAPDQYTVIKGDTLWSISGRFLNQPWRWPELWKMNQEQIKNPHLIYPGDVLVLDRAGMSLTKRDTVKLSPRIRVEPLQRAVPSIPPATIAAFLSKPLVVGQNELDSAARIVATPDDRVAVGSGEVAYAEGITKERGTAWQIFRRGDALVDPETKETLGYQAIYIGEARVRRFGEVSTLDIVKTTQEVYRNDRLLPASKEQPVFAYVPRAPQKTVSGYIVSTYGGLGEAGPKSIVALSKGSKDGLEVGHVLGIYRNERIARYATRTSPLFGRAGPSGNDHPRPYYPEEITPRDGPLYPRSTPVSDSDFAKIPQERYGLVMVFRTFDRAAFGLVMEASRPVTLNDVVTNP
ncbi:MAG: hypothetical protein A2W68_10245 [Betaproteobacteria bacterium RIFCSPLOWO2_02_64_14]|nr:MAG: hypothetical protein A2W68_10245 [Betaproteobacteria bacterium RIFCSPLOWO2_02_64_14]